jgi:hypothetical protein
VNATARRSLNAAVAPETEFATAQAGERRGQEDRHVLLAASRTSAQTSSGE